MSLQDVDKEMSKSDKNLNNIISLLDDNKSMTLCSSSSNDKDLLKSIKDNSKIEISKKVGHSIAEKITAKKIKKIIFDRNGYKYHGRLKALADGARDNGMEF